METLNPHRHNGLRGDPYYNSKAWRSLRQFILKRDNFTCQGLNPTPYINHEGNLVDCLPNKPLVVHHIIERADGGPDKPSNLITLCYIHHQLVHGGWARRTQEEIFLVLSSGGCEYPATDKGYEHLDPRWYEQPTGFPAS